MARVFFLFALLVCSLVPCALAAFNLQHVEEHNTDTFQVSRPLLTYYNEDDDDGYTEVGVAFPDFQYWTLGLTPQDQQVERFDFEHPAEIPFVHLQLDYNPVGHPGGFGAATTQNFLSMSPEEQMQLLVENGAFFGVQHFDVHFMLKPQSFVNAITCSGGFPPCMATPEELARFSNAGPLSYYPTNYFLDPTAYVPAMGSHLERDVDKDRDEFIANGEFIFGSYDGEILFYEPMISVAHFESVKAEALASDSGTASRSYSIPQPQHFIQDGYWPLSYKVAYDVEDEYYLVALTDLRYRDASGPLASASVPSVPSLSSASTSAAAAPQPAIITITSVVAVLAIALALV